MYNWRKRSKDQKEDLLNYRKQHHLHLHSIPNFKSNTNYYHISAVNYEHKQIIGKKYKRITEFERILFKIVSENNTLIDAYAILPNHYHILLQTSNIKLLLKELFLIHQKTGYYWNKEDNLKGRRVWCNIFDAPIKSGRRYRATVNYIHNNPVKHGYAKKWQDWALSSATAYLEKVGIEETENIWKEYDISEMCLWDK